MSGEEFLESAFGRDSDLEKVEQFEQSTLKLLLRRIGWTKRDIDIEAAELGPGFTFDWFNEQGLADFPIFADRCFHFNIQELLTKPLKCPLIQQFHERWVANGREDMAVIFKAFNLGRIVVTKSVERTHGAPCIVTLIEPETPVYIQTWDVFCPTHFTEEEEVDDV